MDRNKTVGRHTKSSAAHYSTFIHPCTYKHTGVPSHEKVKKRWTSRDRNVPINTGHATVDSRSHTFALFSALLCIWLNFYGARLWRTYAFEGKCVSEIFWIASKQIVFTKHRNFVLFRPFVYLFSFSPFCKRSCSWKVRTVLNKQIENTKYANELLFPSYLFLFNKTLCCMPKTKKYVYYALEIDLLQYKILNKHVHFERKYLLSPLIGYRYS